MPENEELRLLELKKYEVLDTLPEKIYDGITAIASEICGTPIALVSLIDEERQWFKSHHGIDATETPRDISFCGHAINQTEGVFEITNSSLDPRFADNPLVTGAPGVIFYAGAPLKTPDGLQIGTLCVIDHKPNKLNSQQAKILEQLAKQVVSLLELRKVSTDLIDSVKRERELAEVARINQVYLDTTLKCIGDAVIATSAEDEPRVLFLNAVAEELTGWLMQEAKGRLVQEVFNIVNIKTRDRAFDPVARVLHAGKVSGLANHTALISKSGREYLIEDSAAPIQDAEGRVSGVVLVFRDVTEKQLLQQRSDLLRKVAESERSKFQSMFSVSPIGLALVTGPELKFEMVNSRFAKLVGPRDYLSRRWSEVYPEFQDSDLLGVIQGVLESGVPFEAKAMRLKVDLGGGNSAERFYDFTYNQILDAELKPYGVLIQCSDVSPNVLARIRLEESEAKLRKSQDSLNAAIDVAKIGFFDWDIINDKVNFSAQMQSDWGISANFKLSEAIALILPEDRERVTAAVTHAMAKGTPYNVQYRIQRPTDGKVIWIEARGLVIFDGSHKPIGFNGTSVDITNRKLSEAQVLESKTEAERANSAKSSFLANMSHEIARPLEPLWALPSSSRIRTYNIQR